MQLAANWPDLLEKDFRKIYQDQYKALPRMVPDLFNVMKSEAAFEKTSAVGQVPDFVEFTGKVAEVSPTQGFDKTYTFTEYAAKIEIQRKLAADDLLKLVVEKLSYMLGRAKAFITNKVIIWRIQLCLISRKGFQKGLIWVG